MLTRRGYGAPGAPNRGIARHLVIALLAAAQLAILALGPLVDPPPSPVEHRAHIAAESQDGCHPYHDDHCVVCRALSGDVVDTPAGVPAPESRVRQDLTAPPNTWACTQRSDLSGPRARGPPHA